MDYGLWVFWNVYTVEFMKKCELKVQTRSYIIYKYVCAYYIVLSMLTIRTWTHRKRYDFNYSFISVCIAYTLFSYHHYRYIGLYRTILILFQTVILILSLYILIKGVFNWHHKYIIFYLFWSCFEVYINSI